MRNLLDENEPLVSGLVFQDSLSVEEILSALLNGKKIKLKNADNGFNFYLKDGEIKSDSISYTKGIPQMWFNKDIKFVLEEQ